MKFDYSIRYYKAANYTEGRTMPIIAFVNHRMVGTLSGTTSHFQNPDTQTSSTFGVGIINGDVKIRQFVPLDDTPWANGNYDPSGSWDNWGYQPTQINAQTVSIEHQDMDGTDAGKGIVKPEVQQASIDLQALLLEGTMNDWRDAGIVMRDWNNYAAIKEQILAIVPGPRTIITHNDISGKLKPYCWKPWAQDTIGFPRQKYIDGILYYTKPIYTQDELDTVSKTFSYTISLLTAEKEALTEENEHLHEEIAAQESEIMDLENEVLSLEEQVAVLEESEAQLQEELAMVYIQDREVASDLLEQAQILNRFG
jgi:hypothetical protein